MKRKHILLATILFTLSLLLGACSATEPIARVHGTQPTFLPPSQYTTLTFDTVDFDSSSMFDGTSRFTVAQDSICTISARSRFMLMNSGEYAELTIQLNGSISIAGDNIYTHTNSSPLLNTSTVYHLDTGDYVEAIAFHDASDTLRAVSTSFSIDCR